MGEKHFVGAGEKWVRSVRVKWIMVNTVEKTFISDVARTERAWNAEIRMCGVCVWTGATQLRVKK